MTLRVNALIGFGGGGGAPISIVGTVAGNVQSAVGTTHALGNINVGASNSDKKIILGLTFEDIAGGRFVSSITVGGVGLSEEIRKVETAGAQDVGAGIYVGDISSISGSQAISVTFSGDVTSSGVSGVAVEGLQSLTGTMNDEDTTASGAQITITSLAAPADGISFACGTSQDRASTATWGSLTERADVQSGGAGNDHRHTAAWDLGSRSAAGETLDFTGGSSRVVVGAGFR